MGWDKKFSEPIPLPKGKKLATLRDAAVYIAKLPMAEHNADEWQANCTSLTWAEWLCRTVDRIDPPRVPGSYRRFW
jgi:hypothetical protein